MLANTPGEEQRGEFVIGWLALCDGFEVGRVDAVAVGVLQEQATGNLLEDTRGMRGADFNEAKVLLGGEAGAGFGRERWRGDGFHEELGDFLGCCDVYLAVDSDDGTEGGDRIGGEGFLVGFEDCGACCGSARIGVLDDGYARLVKLLCQIPAGVEVDEVVEA